MKIIAKPWVLQLSSRGHRNAAVRYIAGNRVCDNNWLFLRKTMRNSTKNLIFPLTAIMLTIGLTSLMLFAAHAAETNLPVIYASAAQGKAGDIVEVNIGIRNNPGISSMRLFVFYDDTALRLVGRAMDKGVLGAQFHSDKLTSPYTLLWENGTVNENYTVNGNLAALEFEILSEAGSDINLKYDFAQYDILNVKLESVHFDVENGRVHAGTPTPENINMRRE